MRTEWIWWETIHIETYIRCLHTQTWTHTQICSHSSRDSTRKKIANENGSILTLSIWYTFRRAKRFTNTAATHKARTLYTVLASRKRNNGNEFSTHTHTQKSNKCAHRCWLVKFITSTRCVCVCGVVSQFFHSLVGDKRGVTFSFSCASIFFFISLFNFFFVRRWCQRTFFILNIKFIQPFCHTQFFSIRVSKLEQGDAERLRIRGFDHIIWMETMKRYGNFKLKVGNNRKDAIRYSKTVRNNDRILLNMPVN